MVKILNKQTKIITIAEFYLESLKRQLLCQYHASIENLILGRTSSWISNQQVQGLVSYRQNKLLTTRVSNQQVQGLVSYCYIIMGSRWRG
jgi:hypothetical protein